VRKHPFLATKVWTSGREAGIRQMHESLKRLRTQRMDLMQIHNLVDYRTQLATLRHWKEQGKVRYIGVTHYTPSAHDERARVLTSEDLDFVQINYSILEREAERRLLPLAVEKRVAVLANGLSLPEDYSAECAQNHSRLGRAKSVARAGRNFS
jgi:diketogulonate reductase-like aldo/keto reductase